MLTVVVSSFQGAVAQRFFLGLVESAVSPGFVLRAFLPLPYYMIVVDPTKRCLV